MVSHLLFKSWEDMQLVHQFLPWIENFDLVKKNGPGKMVSGDSEDGVGWDEGMTEGNKQVLKGTFGYFGFIIPS